MKIGSIVPHLQINYVIIYILDKQKSESISYALYSFVYLICKLPYINKRA